MVMPHHHNAGQNHNTKMANKSFDQVAQFKYLEMTVANQSCYNEKYGERLLPIRAESFLFLSAI
jgi:hypothetical protein